MKLLKGREEFKARWLSLQGVTTLFVALTLGITSTLLVGELLEEDPWRPLGPFPVQTVLSDEAVVSEFSPNEIIPSISIESETVTVVGRKCAKESVAVRGYVQWNFKQPVSNPLDKEEGTGERIEGCQSFRFENQIPDDIKELARETLEKGKQPELALSGCETPFKEDGAEGETLCWQTQLFAFVE